MLVRTVYRNTELNSVDDLLQDEELTKLREQCRQIQQSHDQVVGILFVKSRNRTFFVSFQQK